MSSAGLNLTRRRFMLISALGVAAPLLTNLAVLVSESKEALEAKAAKKENSDYANPKCKGCQLCTIFFSNCLAVNNRVCWREPAVPNRYVAWT